MRKTSIRFFFSGLYCRDLKDETNRRLPHNRFHDVRFRGGRHRHRPDALYHKVVVMSAAARLIVALDTEESLRHIIALSQAGVTFFKLNATTVMEPAFFAILHLLGKIDADFFLDLKVYDTRDTVYNVARRAFDLGARFLTVHATPSMLE